MPVLHVFCVVGVSAGKGMKPFPALGALLAKAPQGYACLSALCGLARKNIPREMRLSQRRGERQGCAGICVPWRFGEKRNRIALIDDKNCQ